MHVHMIQNCVYLVQRVFFTYQTIILQLYEVGVWLHLNGVFINNIHAHTQLEAGVDWLERSLRQNGE